MFQAMGMKRLYRANLEVDFYRSCTSNKNGGEQVDLTKSSPFSIADFDLRFKIRK